MRISKHFENIQEAAILFLHFLVMASALFSFTRNDKSFHSFEDLVHSSHMLIDKVVGVDLEEPMISFVFFKIPMSSLHAFGQGPGVFLSLLDFLLLGLSRWQIAGFVFR